MIQPTLFDEPAVQTGPYGNRPFVRGSATSEAAAQSQSESKTARDRAAILAAIRREGADGLTDQEIEWATNQPGISLHGDTIRPRRNELLAAKLIVKSGRTRLTTKGRPAVVWVAREFHTSQETDGCHSND